MSQNGQRHFKNLAANAARILSVSEHFGTLCIAGLKHNSSLLLLAILINFCYTYVNFLNFASFLHKSQQLRFSRKTRILVKPGKITCLFTVNKYFHRLPWVDCLILHLLNYLERKRNFNIRMHFMLNLSCLVLRLDSPLCVGNNILPDMYN